MGQEERQQTPGDAEKAGASVLVTGHGMVADICKTNLASDFPHLRAVSWPECWLFPSCSLPFVFLTRSFISFVIVALELGIRSHDRVRGLYAVIELFTICNCQLRIETKGRRCKGTTTTSPALATRSTLVLHSLSRWRGGQGERNESFATVIP